VFTGIIRDVGRIAQRRDIGGDRRFTVQGDALDLAALPVGASVAVNGVCLTVVAHAPRAFVADVSSETLSVTTFGSLGEGDRVNIEPALRLGDSLDGHWVTGHVDGVGHVVAIEPSARARIYRIALPAALARYVAKKGSIAVDGTSLTVNEVDGTQFAVTIIPHTQRATIIGDYAVGTAVNIEVDIVARYMERLRQTDAV
jgi:riboflavin synthase